MCRDIGFVMRGYETQQERKGFERIPAYYTTLEIV